MNANLTRSPYTTNGAGEAELTCSASDWLRISRKQLAERHDFILDSLGALDPVRQGLLVQAIREGDGAQVLAILQANVSAHVEHCIKHKLTHSFTGCRDEFEALESLFDTYPTDAARARQMRRAA